jgi:hypothetical protein
MGRFYDLVRALICSLHSMPLALCETLCDLHLALYALRLRDNAMRYAPCAMHAFETANFFMEGTSGFI